MMPALVAAVLIAFNPTQTRADTIALSFTGGSVAGSFNSDLTVGWAFSLGDPTLLTQLGLWDENSDGFQQSHKVTIWNSSGGFITSAIIPAGTTGTLADGFRYISVAPMLLAPGDYVIGAFFTSELSGDLDAFVETASTVTTASGVNYSGSRTGVGDGFPSSVGDSNSYFGPNFQFTSATSVPDIGSTVLLLSFSLFALLLPHIVGSRKVRQ
jgi:hypothetical protein